MIAGSNGPLVPGLYFDAETAVALAERLAALETSVREARRQCNEGESCDRIQVTALRLRDDRAALVGAI